MQDILCLPPNLQGSPPPTKTGNTATMEVSADIRTKELSHHDSGIFSATGNSTFPEEEATKADNIDSRSDCSSPEKKFDCPLCDYTLTSKHDFAKHIQSHKNDKDMINHTEKKPLVCNLCGDYFPSQNSMMRHMRTHRSDSYESDSSTDSSKLEYNNNKISVKSDLYSSSKKRKLEPIDVAPKRFKDSSDEDCGVYDQIRCPVCDRTDFSSNAVLEMHLQDNHPDFPAKCHQCGQMFKNNKLLNFHRVTFHTDDSHKKNYIVGFKDLTYMDFSSEKFKHIARVECERNFHKTTGALKFVCSKCQRGFPCANSLDIHQKDCSIGLDLSMNETLDLSKNGDLRRADFFARLDLQDKSPEPKPKAIQTNEAPPPVEYNKLQARLLERAIKTIDNSKDLADIQSIISMTTNGSLLQQLQAKTTELTVPTMLQDLQPQKNEEEEAQDLFTAEFRKMKLRGEFPCRLCDAVFPNLRALKGHNRTHLNGSNNGTYRCNMCPHSSIDKAALIRHMRTHNGDRPYECSLCNYAFTTKANCERHLRNRHAKTTREEVKKNIIYHPSEDPTNDELNKLAAKDDFKKIELDSPEKIRSSTPKYEAHPMPTIPKLDMEIHPDFNALMPIQAKLQALKEAKFASPISPYIPPNQFAPNFTNTSTPTSKIHVKSLDLLKQPQDVIHNEQSDEEPEEAQEQPMDMVLDLSKKKVEEDLKKSKEKFASNDILQQQLLKTPPKFDSLYANQLAMMYRNSFPTLGLPNWPGFPINPLLFQTMQNPLLQQDPQELKERLQRLQMVGNGMMMDNFSEQLKNFNPYHQAPQPKPEMPKFPMKNEELKPLSLNIENGVGSYDMHKSPLPPHTPKELMHSPNSVKMVIKNGVLMPKQKQRRYRTERPFSCEHCSARFTLRSNMERHIKQQHPQYWSQRQRSNVGTPGRKPQNLPANVNVKTLCDLNIPTFEAPKIDYDHDNKDHISEKIKYAILAQHLRQASAHEIKKEEVDDDCALVIDEKDENRNEPKTEDQNGDVVKVEEQAKSRILEDKLRELRAKQIPTDFSMPKPQHKTEEAQDLVPVSRLLDNANQQPFREYFRRDTEENDGENSEDDEEGLVASGSTSEGNNSGTDENRSESEVTNNQGPVKKKSAYSLAPNRVTCPYCSRKFPWTSSLRRHILTHTGQKPYKCSHCPLLFTTKSNCDRHLLRKHGNTAQTISNEQTNANNTNFLMRNVPERPFKCSTCPSSTFSTYSNLKKHMSCKHSGQGDELQARGYEAGSSEDEKVIPGETKEYESAPIPSKPTQEANIPNSDLPFKCHLCEGSFGDRQDALDHIRDRHVSEYEILMSKNALDNNSSTPDESVHQDEEETDMRGKFPDYSNRKVICAFCMRRFWSAEDLRRHMRTHTGERPFSCDICRRRFTLKHSMLRHRKKHNVGAESDNVNSDEDNMVPSFEPIPPKEKLVKAEKEEASDGNEGGSDLISNLLGIRDRSIIEQVLTASADDAAKLLGVKDQDRDVSSQV